MSIEKKYSTKCKENIFISMYNKSEKKKEWVTNPFPITGQIQLKKVEEFQVVYIRHTGNYTSLAKEYARLMENLFRAAAKQKLLKADENQVLAMYHDNPEFGKDNGTMSKRRH